MRLICSLGKRRLNRMKWFLWTDFDADSLLLTPVLLKILLFIITIV